MFYEGDLQSGISTAIQQQKLVTCFVHDDEHSSAVWEHELLPSMSQLLAEKTVLLKMRLHSQEASFLSAFCPLEVAPSLAVIDNGRVVVKLQAPVDESIWRSQLDSALRSRDVASTAPSAAQPQRPQPIEQHAGAAPDDAPRLHQNSTPASAYEETSSTLQSLMPDRAARLEADQATKQAQEKAARVARAEAKRREAEAATRSTSDKGKQPASDSQPPKARTDWIREQAKRKEEAKEERGRILRQIEADKEERRLKTAIAKETLLPAQPMRVSSQSTNPTNTCSLQIRLLDGSSIRKQFTAEQTLKGDVRRWIDTSAPFHAIAESFTFRHLLAPQPNRDLEPADEERSLRDLGLTPSATLVLVPGDSEPITKAPFGLVSRFLATLLGILASILAIFTGGRNGSAKATELVQDTSQPSSSIASGVDTGPRSAKMRTKTLADSRAEARSDDAPAEFYNGNSSAFEGRKDDDGE